MTLDQLPPRYREQALRQLGMPASGKGCFAIVQPSATATSEGIASNATRTALEAPRRKMGQSTLRKAPTAEEASKTVHKSRPTLTPDQAGSIVKDVRISPTEIRFVLAVNPQAIPTAQQKGVFVGKDGRAHFFTKAKIAKAEKTLVAALKPYASHSRSWGRVPLELCFDFYFSYPSGTPKKDLHKIGPMLQKPDGDNLLKGPADSLTEAGFWEDDSLIANYLIRKRRTTQSPCIVIKIVNLQPKFEALYRETEAHDSPTLFDPPTTTTPSETNPLQDLKTTTFPSSPQEVHNYTKTTQEPLNTTGISPQDTTTKGTL